MNSDALLHGAQNLLGNDTLSALGAAVFPFILARAPSAGSCCKVACHAGQKLPCGYIASWSGDLQSWA